MFSQIAALAVTEPGNLNLAVADFQCHAFAGLAAFQANTEVANLDNIPFDL